MKNILVIREQLKLIYGKYEFVIIPIYKFLIALISFMMINSHLGYFEKIDSTPIAVVAALFCSFMPFNITLVLDGLFIILHMYALNMAAFIVVGILLLLLLLLYFRFSPKDSQVVLLTPILFAWKLPYVVPVVCGLMCTPVSALSIAVGTITYFVLKFVVANDVVLTSSEDDTLVVQFRLLVDGILKDKSLIIWIVAFAVTVILVYTIRRLSINHAWMIAMISGSLIDVVILLLGALVYDMDISFLGALLGTIVTLLIAKVFEFLFFNVDYNRIEYVQYEDDEYYYYVKAVPKNAVAKPEKSVKKVSSATKPLPLIDREMLRDGKEEAQSDVFAFQKKKDTLSGRESVTQNNGVQMAGSRSVQTEGVSKSGRTLGTDGTNRAVRSTKTLDRTGATANRTAPAGRTGMEARRTQPQRTTTVNGTRVGAGTRAEVGKDNIQKDNK